MKVFEFLKSIFLVIFHPLTVWWSNVRWNSSRKDYPLREEDLRQDDESILDFVKRVSQHIMYKFNYRPDDISQLGDSTPPPGEIYGQFVERYSFFDDCDGYHSALYHVLAKQKVQCYLLEILSASKSYGHCVIGYIDEHGQKHIFDYLTDRTLSEDSTFSNIVQSEYKEKVGNCFDLFLLTFDYYNGKFINVPQKKYIFQTEA